MQLSAVRSTLDPPHARAGLLRNSPRARPVSTDERGVTTAHSLESACFRRRERMNALCTMRDSTVS